MRSTLPSSIIKLLMWSLSLITGILGRSFFFFVAGTVQVVSCPGPHRAGQVRANEINSILPSWPKGYNKTCNYANIYSYSVKKKVVRYQDALHELVDLWKWFDKIVYRMIHRKKYNFNFKIVYTKDSFSLTNFYEF